MRRTTVLGLILVVFALTARMRAEVTLAPLFSDHGVLQRDKVIPIWGKAAAGEKVIVTFGGQHPEATGGLDGHWLAFLDPLPASGVGADLIVAGTNTITLHDLVVGEVWLCSGQSKMEWPVSRAADASREIAMANFPLLRHVRIEHIVSETPAETVATSGWQAATPQTAGTFTAVG